jgi:polyribonucleotide nucleotidyltransferase
VKFRRSLLGWLLVAAGLVAVVAGWTYVQNTRDVPVQMAYLASGGVVGVALVAIGAGLVGGDDLHAIRTAVEELRDRFDDLEFDLADARDRLGGTAPRQDGDRTRSSV